MSHEHEPPELAAVERVLAVVAPAPPRIDRDRLMFLAGIASATPGAVVASGGREPAEVTAHSTRNNWFWPASTAALAATSLALAVALAVQPDPPERIVYLVRPATNPASTPAPVPRELPHVTSTLQSRSAPAELPANNYLRSREVALRFGLDALGSPANSGGGGSPAPTYRAWLESFVPPQPSSPGPMPESSQM